MCSLRMYIFFLNVECVRECFCLDLSVPVLFLLCCFVSPSVSVSVLFYSVFVCFVSLASPTKKAFGWRKAL